MGFSVCLSKLASSHYAFHPTKGVIIHNGTVCTLIAGKSANLPFLQQKKPSFSFVCINSFLQNFIAFLPRIFMKIRQRTFAGPPVPVFTWPRQHISSSRVNTSMNVSVSLYLQQHTETGHWYNPLFYQTNIFLKQIKKYCTFRNLSDIGLIDCYSWKHHHTDYVTSYKTLSLNSTLVCYIYLTVFVQLKLLYKMYHV